MLKDTVLGNDVCCQVQSRMCYNRSVCTTYKDYLPHENASQVTLVITDLHLCLPPASLAKAAALLPPGCPESQLFSFLLSSHSRVSITCSSSTFFLST
ncbi:hypothetical protein E2C01_011822 [Portunus trituberculatus]|uniref:Uncharacterized protein n=1 Tax=Portunus trituberculatus TaxID=210409 RepID=A0A5B7DC02_PORTR|nr:hypothetical protein [Portunus trituberculatus]